MSEQSGSQSAPNPGDTSDPTYTEHLVFTVEDGIARFPFDPRHMGVIAEALERAGVKTTIINRDEYLAPDPIPVPDNLTLQPITQQDIYDAARARGLDDKQATRLTTRAYRCLLRARPIRNAQEQPKPYYAGDEDISLLLGAIANEQEEIVPEVLEALVHNRRIGALRNVGEELEEFYGELTRRHRLLHGEPAASPPEETNT